MAIMFSNIFLEFFERNLTVLMVIMAVLVARFLMKRLPKKYSFVLWGIVAVRMLFDLRIPSVLSLFNLFPVSDGESQPLLKDYQMSRIDAIAGRIVAGNVQTLNTQIQGFSDVSAASTVSPSHVILSVMCIIWLIGIAVVIIYGVISYIQCKKITAQAVRMKENVWECDNLPSPFVLGLFKAKIYIPFHMSKEEREYILAHEKYHIKRKDNLTKFLAFLLLAVYWFNPFAWIAYVCMIRDMEMSCDEAVLSEVGEEIKQAYSMSLLSFATGKNLAFAPLAFGESDASKRIKNVLRFKKPRLYTVIIAVVVIVVISVICLTNKKDSHEDIERITDVEQNLEGNNTEETNGLNSVRPHIIEWAEAFVNRDGKKIVSVTSDEVQRSLEDRGLLNEDNDNIGFGYSSPWPVQQERSYRIVDEDEDDNKVDIIYYAWTSEPHISIWHETICFYWDGDIFTVTEEELYYCDNIASGKEYEEAYLYGINNTPMDYLRNGLGEALNINARLYGNDLYSPETAVKMLLNLLNDDDKVKLELVQDGSSAGTCTVKISFIEDGVDKYVRMVQPWGNDGIWIPQDCEE